MALSPELHHTATQGDGQGDVRATISVLAALFLVALPVLTYMFLTGMWLVQCAVGESLAHRR